MEDFETHPRGTGEVLRQLRAEREAFTAFLLEQHERHKHQHNHFYVARNEWARRTQSTQYEALAASKPEPQAQGEEPKVVADALYLDGQPWDVTFTPGKWDHLLTDERYTKQQLITMQSHREAIAEVTRRFEELKRHGVPYQVHNEAIAKKDAALLACVEALKLAMHWAGPAMERDMRSPSNSQWMVEKTQAQEDSIYAAITHANQVLDRKEGE